MRQLKGRNPTGRNKEKALSPRDRFQQSLISYNYISLSQIIIILNLLDSVINRVKLDFLFFFFFFLCVYWIEYTWNLDLDLRQVTRNRSFANSG